MRKWIPPSLIGLAFVFSAIVFNRLPERMPIHWNLRGEVDGFGSRTVAAFAMPAMALVIWGVLLLVPGIDPRRAHIEQARGAYDTLIAAIIAILVLIHGAMLGAALGWPIAVMRIVPLAIGTMIIVVGALLPRFQSNFFIGIRTPWTLSSERVWARTHRVGGQLMVAAGALLIASAFIASEAFFVVAIVSVAAVAVFTILYSYILWRGERNGA